MYTTLVDNYIQTKINKDLGEFFITVNKPEEFISSQNGTGMECNLHRNGSNVVVININHHRENSYGNILYTLGTVIGWPSFYFYTSNDKVGCYQLAPGFKWVAGSQNYNLKLRGFKPIFRLVYEP